MAIDLGVCQSGLDIANGILGRRLEDPSLL